MTDQTKAARDVLVERIRARMQSGETFTCSQLSDVADGDYRLADREIQRFRKAGWIGFVRVGRAVNWDLTDAGWDEVRRQAAQKDGRDGV